MSTYNNQVGKEHLFKQLLTVNTRGVNLTIFVSNVTLAISMTSGRYFLIKSSCHIICPFCFSDVKDWLDPILILQNVYEIKSKCLNLSDVLYYI